MRYIKKIGITAIVTFLLVGCSDKQNKIERSAEQINSLKHVIHKLSTKNDSLEKVLAKNKHLLYPISDGRDFLAKGINDPEEYIKQSLRNSSKIIPLEPVLGGTMYFTKINILDENWVVTYYEDGHIMGKALYAYELQPDTTIEFQMLISARPR